MALQDFRNRVHRNVRHWGKWARRRGIECYRVYDRDIPEHPFCLDIYGEHAHLQEYRHAADQMGPERDAYVEGVRRATAEVLGLALERVHLKRRTRRHAGEQHERTGLAGEDFVVHEGGHRFLVNLDAYLDSGLFLDHRNTRSMVAREAGGKRFLNLFCYTASFTVYAACAGAPSSISVDLSNTYLDWGARNFALNDIDPGRHRLVRADAVRWLEAGANGGEFDVVLLDPPSFSTSKAMEGVLDIQRDHGRLLEACARVLAPGGVLYFSTNLRTFKFAVDACPSLVTTEISAQTVPEDFRNRRIHRCWRMTRG